MKKEKYVMIELEEYENLVHELDILQKPTDGDHIIIRNVRVFDGPFHSNNYHIYSTDAVIKMLTSEIRTLTNELQKLRSDNYDLNNKVNHCRDNHKRWWCK